MWNEKYTLLYKKNCVVVAEFNDYDVKDKS